MISSMKIIPGTGKIKEDGKPRWLSKKHRKKPTHNLKLRIPTEIDHKKPNGDAIVEPKKAMNTIIQNTRKIESWQIRS